MATGTRHVDKFKTEMMLLLTGTATGNTLWIDMQNYSHATFFVLANNSTGTPAATFTMNQATAVAGTSSKNLAINTYFVASGGFGAQSSAADAWTSSAIASGGSFAAISTVSTIFGYAVEVNDTDLDLTNNFKAVLLAVSATASISVAVWAHLFPRFGGNYAAMPTALT